MGEWDAREGEDVLVGYRNASAFLLQHGYRVSHRTLMNKTTLGIGPRVRYRGWNVAFHPEELLEWAKGYRWRSV